MPRHWRLPACLALFLFAPVTVAYVEAPHTLGRCCHESTNIVLVEVLRVNKDKGLIVYKKIQDLKGKHNEEQIKHNIGKRGFHPREWQNVMAWAEVGKRAVFFHNGGASETCIGTYWYQCYKEGEWWGMSHAEPFLLRTFTGNIEKLTAAVTDILAGKEVVVTCLADGNKEQLHLRKGRLQRMKASLRLLDYNPRRDFVAWGGDGDEEEFKTFVLLGESTPGWKYLPRRQVSGEAWRNADFDDAKWRTGKAPIGYGEPEIGKRKGTTVPEKGEPFLFRRTLEVSSDLLGQKGVAFWLRVASDDSAVVYLNGVLVDQDPQEDHEFSYWNRDVEVPAKYFKAGRNVIAVLVKNRPRSSDIYLDMEVSALVPIPKPKIVRRQPDATVPNPGAPGAASPMKLPPDAPGKAQTVSVDKEKRTVTVPCAIAPRKLPNLNEIYPIEVIATYPAPHGQKAHETIVTFTGIKPSAIHKALTDLGLKPGKPARGEGAKAEGPELALFLEYPGADGKMQRVPIEQVMIDRKTGKPIPGLKWHFTGSAFRQPDPEKDDKYYGADLTGTLIALFPVTDDTVIQSHLTMKEEPLLKLDTDVKRLPKEGTPARLIIQVK